MKRTHKPAIEFKVGGIQGSAWKNENADGRYYYTVSLTRLYKTRDNRWQRSTSFRQQDLSPLGRVVAQLQAELDFRAPRLQSASGTITSTIWPNEGPNGPYFTCTITRFYTNEQGHGCLAKTFRPQDLGVVADVVKNLQEKMSILASDPESLRPPKYDPRGELPEEDENTDIFSESEFDDRDIRELEFAA